MSSSGNVEAYLKSPVTRSCPLCESDDHRVFSHKMQYNLNLTTVICNRCGFVFTNPLPTQDAYDAFNTHHFVDYYGHTSPAVDWQAIRRQMPNNIATRLKAIQQFMDLTGKRVMDVGAGNGVFLYGVSQQGAEAIALEQAPEYCARLRERGFTVLDYKFEDIDPQQHGRFDVMTMFHVLEHFYDPNEPFAYIHALLKPDGLFVVEVPNILKPYRSLEGYHLRYVHLSNFSPATLAAFMRKHGFEVLYTDDKPHVPWYERRNLLMIARPTTTTGDMVWPEQSADAVFAMLDAYRQAWRWQLGPRFHMRTTWRKVKHTIRQTMPV